MLPVTRRQSLGVARAAQKGRRCGESWIHSGDVSADGRHSSGWGIENSLLERTVEQELVPMGGEFGLGITPWSPLMDGALSGKYTRHNTDQLEADRGELVDLSEKTYDVVDQLENIAKAHARHDRRWHGAGLAPRVEDEMGAPAVWALD